MVEVINYIFGSLQASSDAIKSMKKILRNQARFNRTLTAFAFTYALMVEIHNYEQDKKIEELSNEIEELKRMKGE